METRWLYVTSEELEQLRDKTGGVCVIEDGKVSERGSHQELIEKNGAYAHLSHI